MQADVQLFQTYCNLRTKCLIYSHRVCLQEAQDTYNLGYPQPTQTQEAPLMNTHFVFFRVT